MDPRNPTFEEVRKRSRNGKDRVRILIYGSTVECRAKTSSTRAQIDFDLFSCNYDLGPFLEKGRIELVDGEKLLDRLVRLRHGYTK